jgi:AcrR family transcriptional regulator
MSRSTDPSRAAPRDSYHHGDLRRAILDAALQDIAARGPASLSLRGLARTAGVSHAAPAHHFGDKSGVFTAVATEGFQLLHESQLGASEGLDPDDTLLPLAVNYVLFAIGHPSYYEVMWREELYDTGDPALVAARERVFAVFYQSVAAGIGELEPEQFPGAVAAAWSVVHGFATLWLNGNLAAIVGTDPLIASSEVAQGLVAIANVTARQLQGQQGTPRAPRTADRSEGPAKPLRPTRHRPKS